MDTLAGDPKDALYSDRVEDKYVFNLSDLESIVKEVEDYLKPDYPHAGTEYTLVKSIYLDTPAMKFLVDDLEDKNERHKLRVRCYGPNGKWSTDKYLEVKYRNGLLRKKVRIKIDMDGFLKVLSGENVPDRTKKLNKDISGSEYDTATSLINQITKPGVSPVLEICYKRFSYRGRGVRITIDTKLEVKELAALKQYEFSPLTKNKVQEASRSFNPSKQGVLEIKYQNDEDCPDWVHKLIDKVKQHSEGFSKMLWGFNEVL